jgi:hypothetical protein
MIGLPLLLFVPTHFLLLRLAPKPPAERGSVRSVLPEILEPVGRHFGVPHRVPDIFVTHAVLKRSSIVAVVGELVAG